MNAGFAILAVGGAVLYVWAMAPGFTIATAAASFLGGSFIFLGVAGILRS